MSMLASNIKEIRAHLPKHIQLVCVSKFHPAEMIAEAYALGERDFGESRAQELTTKVDVLPKDIRWHFIGPLQSNKVKYVVPHAYMIQSVESEKLLVEIEKQASKHQKIQKVLLEIHIAQETTKHGFSEEEVTQFFKEKQWEHYPHVEICGLMGIATLTDDSENTKKEFAKIHNIFDNIKKSTPLDSFTELSIGMSNDYSLAIDEGATIVRIGSAIFGQRDYSK
ncbi:MAG: YggS family pyridoxal phosphate-dependent enzyme [Bacteroidales bacterium]|nr:YggS family pyridoxal phosphate-dependent enzyme [Bacteroidales bacterium]